MTDTNYARSNKYEDLDTIYEQCSGPGGLKLAEFIADKIDLQPGARLIDAGFNQGYQTCFLAEEYGVNVVGIDPWDDPSNEVGTPFVEWLMRNARAWGVEDRILAVKMGLPDTRFADGSFDAAYCTTALNMVRESQGEDRYRECLAEVTRVMRPGTLFGYGDPMHLDVEIPEDLAPLVTEGEGAWADGFATIDETVDAFRAVGFEVVEADYAPDARLWWEEYARHDVNCRANPEGEPRTIEVDGGRWLSYGYVIARKPE
ncbi:MAG: methyltransferase domain-containing protein [bacterium]|nr:methyltransferase domain-containing protein [bacterium]